MPINKFKNIKNLDIILNIPMMQRVILPITSYKIPPPSLHSTVVPLIATLAVALAVELNGSRGRAETSVNMNEPHESDEIGGL